MMVITSVETQKKNKARKSIFIDNKYAFSIDEEDFFRLNLYVGNTLTEDKIAQINRTCNYSKAKKKAMKAILFKMRSEFEVYKKLEAYGFDEPIINEVIEHLKELEYINDDLFAEKYIKYALNHKRFGKERIIQELIKRGVKAHRIYHYIDQIEENEKTRLRPMIEKKMSTVTEMNDKQMNDKQMNRIRNYFIRRGYKLVDINDCINELIINNE